MGVKVEGTCGRVNMGKAGKLVLSTWDRAWEVAHRCTMFLCIWEPASSPQADPWEVFPPVASTFKSANEKEQPCLLWFKVIWHQRRLKHLCHAQNPRQHLCCDVLNIFAWELKKFENLFPRRLSSKSHLNQNFVHHHGTAASNIFLFSQSPFHCRLT